MAEIFNLPEIGEGVVEGEIVEWFVAPGDQVKPDQPLASVMTDKATVEIPSDFSGTITRLAGEVGFVVSVGELLVEFGSKAEIAQAPQAPQTTGEANARKSQSSSLVELPLPEIGEGVVEGEIVAWVVAPGDVVAVDQVVVTVLTDKATVEITSPAAGTVLEINGAVGELVSIGTVIMKLQSSEGGISAAGTAAETVAAPAVAAVPAASAVALPADMDNPSLSAFGTPLATPSVRRLARLAGIDLTRVVGTGPKHRITRADLEGAQAAPQTQPKPAAPAPQSIAIKAGEDEHREKIRGMRKAIHASMTRSKSVVPHFTYVDEIEMDALVTLRGWLKDEAAEQGVKLNYLPFIAKAVVLAIKKFPILNCSVDDTTSEIVYKHRANIGIATASSDGLIVPVVKNADAKSVLQLAREISEITDRARNRKASMDDLSGGTFTITSLGRLGGLLATPIINYPEVGILGIHNLQDRAVVREGQIVVRKMMNLSLSCDHRVVDGDVAASFVQEIKSYLEKPGKMLMVMT